jgi:hypothetical protein
MGEIAEMMLEGILCEGCGEFMGGSSGYPRRCRGCGPEISLATALKRSLVTPAAKRATRHNRERKERAKAANKPFECECGKLCRTFEGLKAHAAAKHPSVFSPEGKP